MMTNPNNVTQQANEAVVDEVFKVAPPVDYLIDFQAGSIAKEEHKW